MIAPLIPHARFRRRAIGTALLWFVVPIAASAQTVIADTPTCPSCRLETRIIVDIGTSEGPGALPGTPHTVVLDAVGRYWVVFWGRDLPLVYSADGKFIRAIGRRGAGPGEFASAQTAVPVPGDSVLVLDHRNGRATIIDRELNPARTIRIPREQLLDVSSVRWPVIAVNSVLRTARDFGWPLHVLDMSGEEARLIKSFGLNSGLVRSTDVDNLSMRLAAERPNKLWAAEELVYRISEWDSQGNQGRIFERKPAWFAGLSNGLQGGPTKPAAPRIAALKVDSIGRLWVFALVSSPDYRRHWDKPKPGARSGNTEVPVSQLPSLDKLYQTTVEVIDPKSARIVARGTIRQAVIAALPGGRIATYAEDAGGIPRVSIRSVAIVR